MNKLRFTLRALLLVAIPLALASLALGQATRTWVSGVGDDANPCSRTAPCKTFAGAISKTAKDGEIDALDPGGFGAVTITKSITIDGSGTLGSILGAQTNGVIINITGEPDSAKAVRLRGLSINGAGSGINGIRVVAANTVSIEDTVIHGFTKDAISIESKSATRVFVNNTTMSNNLGAGISIVTGDAQAALCDVRLIFNGTGLSAGSGAITSFGNVVKYGNKNGDR